MRLGAKLFMVFLIASGGLLVLDTLFVSRISNLNLGVVMPLIIGAPLLLIGILYPFLRPLFVSTTFGRLVKWAIIAAYSGFFVLFGATTITILAHSNDIDADSFDALIVLGGGVRDDQPSLVLKHRLDVALDCYNENPRLIIVVSGGKRNEPDYSEAYVMSKYLLAHGVPEDKIVLEESASSTEENFALSHALIAERLGEDAIVAFVTTQFHVYRAGGVAKKMGIDAVGIASKDIWYIAPNNFLRECAAIVQYKLSGRI